MNPHRIALWLVPCLLALSGCSRPVQQVPAASRTRAQPWDQELVDMVATLPVQQEGRVKPFGTLAAFTLYAVHGRRDLQFAFAPEPGRTPQKITLTPVEWLLDVWFHPDQAADYPLFRIENREVLDAIGMERDGPQRMDFDYVSYRRLLPYGGQLQQQARAALDKEAPDRTPAERQVLMLFGQLRAYHELHQLLAVLDSPFKLTGSEVQKVAGGAETTDFATILRHAAELQALARAGGAGNGGNAAQIVDVLQELAQQHDGPALFAPPESRTEREKWYDLGDLAAAALQGRLDPRLLAQLEAVQAAVGAGADDGARARALRSWHDLAVAGAEARGEYRAVALEADYYALSLHYKALHAGFLPAFLLVALSWLLPRSRWLPRLAYALTAVGLLLVVADVVMRCIIRDRPPITGLYDTFLFICSVGVGAALTIEAINRKRVALSIAPILGALLVMLARLFEVEHGEDPMNPLQAVLDSNYWLATHVTTINIGYAGGMVASLLGTSWLVLGALGVRLQDAAFHKSIVRMTYGATAFGLTFAVVGTILGGVWANDSWGRFWGWDTKENGALMICLAQVSLLHARMCGLVRDFGFCVWAALTGLVVAFSWFHVNLLQVGLHSYGFSEGTQAGLFGYYGVEGGVVLLAAVGRLLRTGAARAPAAVAGVPATAR